MEEKFNWDLPADPDPKSDNYYNGIVSKELKDSSNIAETLLEVIRRESVKNQSDFVNEGIETILDRLGIKTDKPLTRKEKLLAFIGFKAGSIWERLVEDQRQSEPASPNPLEIVMMGLLKTNGKSACVLSSKFVPVSGWWNDKAEVREWQERTRVYKALKELKRKGEDLKLEKAIEPLREVYARVNPSRRSMFIAQVVYLLTK